MKRIFWLVLAVVPFSIAAFPQNGPNRSEANTYTSEARPGPRIGHVLVYDEQIRRVILLSGYTGTNRPDLEQSWAWDGTRWTMIPGSGPTARGMSGAVYDSGRQKLVLYGGVGNRSPEDFRSDTWEWNGKAWSQMGDTGPGSRDHHSMAYDAARNRTVMFGGVSGDRKFATDTWEWDGVKWQRMAMEGPEPRGHFAIAYDSKRKQIVLFGGDGEDGKTYGDTWIWDGRNWRKVSEAGPKPRSRHRMAYDSRAGVVVLYGGQGAKTGPQSPLNMGEDTWAWDGKKWIEFKVPGPNKRYMPAMAYDAKRGKTVLYGGSSYSKADGVRIFGDTWEWDGKIWTKISDQ